ncbi:MAG: succinylglutamate desuccinylase [Saprospiraceae bacterium]|nr:MAG: succinylglutamate desuccinylase [Saprospiraceae bacterium]
MAITEDNKPFLIHNISILPGQKEVIRIPVGQLPAGGQISIRAHVFRSECPGPVMLVMGGVHGDEINGVEIVRRAIERGFFNQLQLGCVIAIPILNIYGFINFSRDVPDGKDVNRSFPGNFKGSLASRVARTLTKKILPFVDFGIDFHTGGRSLYNYPQVRFSAGHAPSESLAKAVGAPCLIASRPIPKSLRKVALENGKPIVVFEGGESLRYDGFAIQKGLEGIKRVMQDKKMILGTPAPADSRIFAKSSWVRADRAGLFEWTKCSGNQVQKGEPIGIIKDPQAQKPPSRIYAPHNGFIIGQNNAPVISQGDALFHLAN